MSAAIGGRSESIGQAPDRSAAQISEEKALKIENPEEIQNFEDLSQEELDILTGADPESLQVPFGARLANLFARKNFRQGLANKFLSAPSGANVDRRKAGERVQTLNEAIERATQAKQQNDADEQALRKSGIRIFAGSPLDIAFSNKRRSFNNIIAQAEAEKKGIALQTDTSERKRVFQNFKVITDKRGGKGRNRGVFDVTGKLGLVRRGRRGAPDIDPTEQFKKQDFRIADTETAIANADEIQRQASGKGGSTTDGNRGRGQSRAFHKQRQLGQAALTGKIVDNPDKEFFTDQILTQRTTKAELIPDAEVAAANADKIAELERRLAPLDAGFNEKGGAFVSVLGRPVPFSKRFSSNMKSGTNSRGISDLERSQFIQKKSAQRNDIKNQINELSGVRQAEIVKFEDNPDIRVNRQASLFEALQTLRRIQGLPQFSGDRGHDTQGKAVLGALNKVQEQRLDQQAKSKAKFQVKQDFDAKLAEIQNSNTLTQAQKKQAIRDAAKERDIGLQGQTVTNTQFEQSRAGFAASVVNLPSGHTVRTVQDFIDIARRRRRLGGNQNA